MRVYASSITEEQRSASGAPNIAGPDRKGFDEVKELQMFARVMSKTEESHGV